LNKSSCISNCRNNYFTSACSRRS